MSTYKNVEFESTDELRTAINSDLSVLAYPFTVKHKVFGEGKLIDLKAPATDGNLYATIDFPFGNKILSVGVLLNAKLLEMPEELLDIVSEAQTAYKLDYDTRKAEQRVKEREERLKTEEAEKKLQEEKKAEAKYQKAKQKAIKDFEDLASAQRVVSEADEFYYSLGYITKHIGTVSAALPDYLEDAFKKYFGPEAPCRVVDSKKKGPAGYTSQWTWSFGISLKKPEAVPVFLQDKLSPSGKSITDTSFVWDLVENYGFQFGKKQNIQNIRNCIPSTYLPIFEAALA